MPKLKEGFRTSRVASFLIIPFLLILGLAGIWKKNGHERNGIPALNLMLQMMHMNLNGVKRLSHANDQKDPGIAIAGGLTKVPDQSLFHRFVKTFTRKEVEGLTMAISRRMHQLGGIFGNIVNIDTHNKPHYGKGKLKKTLIDDKVRRAVITAFAQDQETGNIIYHTNDFRGKTYSELLLFIMKKVKAILGKLPKCLVFDLGFYKGKVFSEIEKKGVKFITLLKRYANAKKVILQKMAENEFREVKVRLPTRKNLKVEAIDTTHRGGVRGYPYKYRLVIVRWPGNPKEVALFTNNFTMSTAEVIETYARRWRIENWFAEAINSHAFDALVSNDLIANDLMDVIRVTVTDVMRMFMSDVGRDYRNVYPSTFFREVLSELRGDVRLMDDGETIEVSIDHHEKLDLLKPIFEKLPERLKELDIDPRVPWLGDLKLEFRFPQSG